MAQTVLTRRKSQEHTNSLSSSELYTLPSSSTSSKPINMHFITKQLDDNQTITDIGVIAQIASDKSITIILLLINRFN